MRASVVAWLLALVGAVWIVTSFPSSPSSTATSPPSGTRSSVRQGDRVEYCLHNDEEALHCEPQLGDEMTSPSAPVDVTTMSISHIKEELKTVYDIADTSDCIEKSDLIRRLQDSRDAQASVVRSGMEFGEVLRVGNRANPTGIVTLSHGLGDSARGWEDVARELAAAHSHLLFLLPTAPQMPVTINMGSVMNAWYDIKGLGPRAPQDPTILKTSHYVTTLARQAANRYRISPNRIIFGGFSQGAALSLASALTAPFRPAGVIVLSGYLASAEYILPKMVNRNLPILMCHGMQDNVIPLALAEASKKALNDAGFEKIDFRTFLMAHSAHPDELRAVSEFLKTHLPPQ